MTRYFLVLLILFSCKYTYPEVFPSKSVRIIVSTAPGGAPDVIARLVAEKLKDLWHQSIVVENKPGAGGNISAAYVAKSVPDGYTLLYYDSPIWAINPHLYKKLPYDPFLDFAPVIQTHHAPLFLVVPTTFSVTSVKQLIEFAKKNPNKVTYASAGTGSSHHLYAEQFRYLADIEIIHIPYKGGAPASIALSSSEVQMGFLSYPLAQAGLMSGKLKILGIGTAQRSPNLPEIPSISESGLPGFDLYTTFGFLAPSGTPIEVISKIHDSVWSAISDHEMIQRVSSYGINLAPLLTPSQFGAVMKEEYEKFGKIVKISGAQMD
jgi:tripartite-type tricarboxylate transporter receptor subunit TctC